MEGTSHNIITMESLHKEQLPYDFDKKVCQLLFPAGPTDRLVPPTEYLQVAKVFGSNHLLVNQLAI